MHVTIWYAAKTPELAERIARGLLIPDIGIDEIPEADYIDDDTMECSFDNGFWYDLYFVDTPHG